jgi:hypothetical protein
MLGGYVARIAETNNAYRTLLRRYPEQEDNIEMDLRGERMRFRGGQNWFKIMPNGSLLY